MERNGSYGILISVSVCIPDPIPFADRTRMQQSACARKVHPIRVLSTYSPIQSELKTLSCVLSLKKQSNSGTEKHVS